MGKRKTAVRAVGPKQTVAYTIEQTALNVHTIRFEGLRAGWEQWILLTGDRHHDNIHCRRDLELEHLDEAKKRNAPIIDVGDLFCAMQGKWDPRRSMDDVRPEDVGANYLDRIVEHAAEFYGPYAKYFAVIGVGNHEDAILAHNNTDLTDRLVYALNTQHGARCYKGGVGGWVRFLFKIGPTQVESRKLKYFHGAGGGGPVTRGVIQTNRQAVYLPDADIVVNGHTHDQYHVPIARERLNMAGTVERDVVHYIRTPTYKDEYGDGSSGWAVVKGHPPKPLGCAWLRFYLKWNEPQGRFRVETDVTLSSQ